MSQNEESNLFFLVKKLTLNSRNMLLVRLFGQFYGQFYGQFGLQSSEVEQKIFIIRDRIRTCNLSVRSRTRYPLRHTDE